MSINEFNNQNNHEYEEKQIPGAMSTSLPADFSNDDLEFAEELSVLFSPQNEEMPPYFAQTLLAAEDPRYKPLDPGFVQKTSAHVFRSLRLRRRLFPGHHSTFRTLTDTLRDVFSHKIAMAWFAAFVLIMMCTVAFTAPSFERGVVYLLHGARSGTMEVHSYPGHVKHPFYNADADFSSVPPQISLFETQQQLHFKMYWPQNMPANYQLTSITVYEDPADAWADGPFLELVYSLNGSIVPNGTGEIVIREFLPKQEVLQVVQDGAAHPIGVDQNGSAKAIYVEGQWLPRGKMTASLWSDVGRRELIFQQNGVVFWIAGDSRDGVNETTLMSIAQSLGPVRFSSPTLVKTNTVTLLQSYDSSTGAFADDVLAVFPDNGVAGPYYIDVSSYAAAMNSQTDITASHGH